MMAARRSSATLRYSDVLAGSTVAHTIHSGRSSAAVARVPAHGLLVPTVLVAVLLLAVVLPLAVVPVRVGLLRRLVRGVRQAGRTVQQRVTDGHRGRVRDRDAVGDGIRAEPGLQHPGEA